MQGCGSTKKKAYLLPQKIVIQVKSLNNHNNENKLCSTCYNRNKLVFEKVRSHSGHHQTIIFPIFSIQHSIIKTCIQIGFGLMVAHLRFPIPSSPPPSTNHTPQLSFFNHSSLNSDSFGSILFSLCMRKILCCCACR